MDRGRGAVKKAEVKARNPLRQGSNAASHLDWAILSGPYIAPPCFICHAQMSPVPPFWLSYQPSTGIGWEMARESSYDPLTVTVSKLPRFEAQPEQSGKDPHRLADLIRDGVVVAAKHLAWTEPPWGNCHSRREENQINQIRIRCGKRSRRNLLLDPLLNLRVVNHAAHVGVVKVIVPTGAPVPGC
jgi:hypothetical protein